jgi:hypothetical protein
MLIVGTFILIFFVIYVFAIVLDNNDFRILRYQLLKDFDFLQFYMNKYQKEGFRYRIKFFDLYFFLVKVNKERKYRKYNYK